MSPRDKWYISWVIAPITCHNDSITCHDDCMTLFAGDDRYGYEQASERWLPIHTVETILISGGGQWGVWWNMDLKTRAIFEFKRQS